MLHSASINVAVGKFVKLTLFFSEILRFPTARNISYDDAVPHLGITAPVQVER